MRCHLFAENPDVECKATYNTIIERFKRNGLIKSNIKRSFSELCEKKENKYYLKSIAFRPTGVVLGCPLNNQNFIQKLWLLSESFDQYLKSISDNNARFAFVPSESYHITIVSHSHFDIDKQIDLMTDIDKEKVNIVIKNNSQGPISIDFKGILLTPEGRLLIPGYPCDNNLYHLRKKLTESVPELRANIPKVAHIKLGHMLIYVENEKSKLLLDWITFFGNTINEKLIFEDVYTPIGRILL
jgi:2'-5' RNA ligase